ncbi:aminopeptidase N [Streptomyces sp. NPDC007856]|uniref:aminopeptidase N n=1 Tax=Streptomyces sp. NPDC007856 TaxID=3364781 RepID=UPI003680CB26
MTQVRDLLYTEARSRARLLRVQEYGIDLDLRSSGETFSSRTHISFTCTRPGADSFVECSADVIGRIRFNGTELSPGQVFTEGRIRLENLAAENTLEVEAVFSYSHDGLGLQRHTDPDDGGIYVYSDAQPYAAHRFFACFDQPDLKAPVRLHVTAPDDWTVLGQAAGRKVSEGHWEFARTQPFSTYFTALAAGHFHEVSGARNGLPLGIHCRRSAVPLMESEAADLFETTGKLLDYFERLFGIPYPFPKLDYVFVPEFNHGGMENPALVTLNEKYLLAPTASDDRRQLRTVIVAHELAHMWFGNLVTPRWWDDLWLNESCAELLAVLAVSEATRHETGWAAFCAGRKEWGHRADRRPAAHPVAFDVLSTAGVVLNLDAITYAKGAGVLQQLMATVGRENFFDGLRDHLRQRTYGNATLDDLITAMERASGQSLENWSEEWLYSPGVNVLRPVVETTDGRIDRVLIEQTAPADRPLLRQHTVAVGLFDRDGTRLVRRDCAVVRLTGPRTEVPELAGRRAPALLLLNDGDHAWARVRLDPHSLTTSLTSLGHVADPLARAVAWRTLWHLTQDAELPVSDFLAASLSALAAETDPNLARLAVDWVRASIDTLGRTDLRAARQRLTARRFVDAAHGRESALRPIFAAAFVDSVDTPASVEVLASWLSGADVPSGVQLDRKFRWRAVGRLAVLGRYGRDEILDELSRDPTHTGELAAATAMTARATAEAKEHALDLLHNPGSMPPALLAAHTAGLFQADQLALCAPYVEPALAALPRLWTECDAWSAARLSTLALPRFHADAATLGLVDELLEKEPHPGLRRLLTDCRFELACAHDTRLADTTP